MTKPITLTAVVPVFNEAQNLPEMIAKLNAMATKLGTRYEVRYLFVNDGSSDETGQILRRARAENHAIDYLTLSRNFGHQAALSAGMQYARDSDLIALLDGDLQDPPEAMPRFLERIEDGYDVVFAIRGSRPEGVIKRLWFQIFYRLANRLSHIPLPVQSGDFSVLTRRVCDAMLSCDEKLRYLRGLRSFVGFKQTGLIVDREARYAGEPKYTLRKLVSLALDGIFSFSVLPLRCAWVTGGLGILICLAYIIYAVLKQIISGTVPEGFTGTIALITFVGSLQLFFIGIVGEYVGRIHAEVKARPVFIIDWDHSKIGH